MMIWDSVSSECRGFLFEKELVVNEVMEVVMCRSGSQTFPA
jgi:hypothetical protein